MSILNQASNEFLAWHF